jgi:hypothetical protein
MNNILKKAVALFLLALVIVMVVNPALTIYIGFKAFELAIIWLLVNGISKLLTKKGIIELLFG